MNDKRKRWGRRDGEGTDADGKPITLRTTRERLLALETRVARDRVESRVLYGVILALIVAGAFFYGKLHDVVNGQTEGRRVAVAVTCAATSAVIDAGRATITGGVEFDPEFQRNLEKLGFPPKRQRKAEADAAAAAYGRLIARRVEAAAKSAGAEGGTVQSLVNENGDLDCHQIGKAARIDVDADGDADGIPPRTQRR